MLIRPSSIKIRNAVLCVLPTIFTKRLGQSFPPLGLSDIFCVVTETVGQVASKDTLSHSASLRA